MLAVRSLSALLVLVSSASSALAVPVAVRVMLQRPGCDFVETQVELRNLDTDTWYKVRVEGTGANESTGPQQCKSGGTPTASCVSSFPGNSEQILSPAGEVGSCAGSAAYLPNCTSCNSPAGSPSSASCPMTSCDNLESTNSHCSNPSCAATCGNASTEWCTVVGDLQVTIVASSSDGTNWTPYSYTLCRKGTYGSSPSCAEESYCTEHCAIRPFCYEGEWDPLCL